MRFVQSAGEVRELERHHEAAVLALEVGLGYDGDDPGVRVGHGWPVVVVELHENDGRLEVLRSCCLHGAFAKEAEAVHGTERAVVDADLRGEVLRE